MFWKVYFILLIAFLIYSYRLLTGQLNAWYYVDLLISVLSLVGLFGLAWKQRFFNANFWKVYFGVYIVWVLAFNLLIGPYINRVPVDATILIGFALLLPLYASLYLYAFKFFKK